MSTLLVIVYVNTTKKARVKVFILFSYHRLGTYKGVHSVEVLFDHLVKEEAEDKAGERHVEEDLGLC